MLGQSRLPIGALNQRHGNIKDVGTRGGKRIVEAAVPLRNMFGYSTRLRSLNRLESSSPSMAFFVLTGRW